MNESTTTATEQRPFQYSLRLLMLAPVGVAVFFMIAAWLGMTSAVLLAGAAGVVGVLLAPFDTLVERLVGIAVVGIFVALLLPGCRVSRCQDQRAAQCRNNLKQIALAFYNYHDTYGSFPPAYVADEDGKPMHGWRVLILPYMEQQPLYDQYDFNEPWDGPNNSKLHDTKVDTYSCPSQPRKESENTTSYVVVVGPETVFPMDQSTTFEDITDGTSNTLLVVEISNSGIHWMEPRDLKIEEMPAVINPGEGRSQGISSMHPEGAQVLWADGSNRFLRNSLPTKTLRAMLTIAGGETLDWDGY